MKRVEFIRAMALMLVLYATLAAITVNIPVY